MSQVNDGQCGLCAHFGEGHKANQQLIQIRTKREAPDTFIESCGHPSHAALNLKVTPISGCAAFERATA